MRRAGEALSEPAGRGAAWTEERGTSDEGRRRLKAPRRRAGKALSTVVVAGLGYVGLPLAMRAVAAGHRVVGYDTDASRVKALATGESYIEDVPAGEVASAVTAGRFCPSSQAQACTGFDVAVITVPTPLRDGLPDLTYVEAASRTLARFLRRGATVIVESTSYPGTTQEQVLPWLEEGSGLSGGADFHLGYSPERIDPGNGTWTLATTPKIVAGIDDESLAAVQDFYRGLVGRTVAVSSPREAELAKLIENTFRHVNIALVNELAMFAHGLGIDVWEAIEAASTKPFGFMRFTPGPGVGGHCLPIDPSYLSWRVERTLGQSFRFVELANDINSHMPDYVVRRLMLALNERGMPVKGARILLLGLAYKKNTGDARESPAVRVAQLLAGMGAVVRAADPHVEHATLDPTVARVEVTPAEIAGADAVVLLTDHDEFTRAGIGRQAAYVLDCRRVLTGPDVEAL
jgi:UDP-N-acetyl-D-glucosamine dehydrogenase